MIASDYLIQVVNKTDGSIVRWAPGLEVEKQLITEVVNRVKAKGVGLMRSESHVLQDVRESFEELLYELKSGV